MTKEEEDEFVVVNGVRIRRPLVARACFTELRLSETRVHATRFGRLGIGFKRFFYLIGLEVLWFIIIQ